jgi:hypothetical protein
MNEETKPNDSTLLALGGAGFLALAGFFLWRDLGLPPAAVLIAAAAAASAATALQWPRRWPGVGPAAMLVVAAGGGLWYLALKSPSLLPGLGIVAAGSAAAIGIRDAGGGWSPGSVWPRRLAWYAAGTAFLVATAAFYFQLFTIGFAADSVARRLIPTIVWLAVGLALLVAGRDRAAPPAHVGLALIAVALGKALLYDTTHLYGPSRVAVLAAVGGLLLAGARVLHRARGAARGHA